MQGISRLALLAALAATPAMAQEDETFLGTITLTALRTAVEAAHSGLSVSVIEGESLARDGSVRLADQLAQLPGISVAEEGGFGNRAVLRLRGFDGRYIAVFVDGIRVDDPSGIQVSSDFGAILSSGIARVEVLRGSQSALWGGSAVGGVINITTLAGAEDGLHQTIGVEGGSHGSAALSYGLTQKDDRLELAFNASHFRTDGISAFDGGSEADGAEASRLSFSARYRISDTLTLGGAAFVQRTRHDFDGYIDTDGDGYTDTFTDMDSSQTRLDRGLRFFAETQVGNTLHEVSLSAFRAGRDLEESGVLSHFTGTRLHFDWQGTTEISPALTLVYGADWSREEARTSAQPGGSGDSEIAGIWGQVIWAPAADLDLIAAFRHDDHSAFGGFDTGRLSFAWRPVENVTLRGAVARGFRAPSLDELYGDYPAFFFTGNPNLTPETSLSYELGADWALPGGAELSATAFRVEVEDRIAADPATFWSTLGNLAGTSVSRGLELSGRAPLTERLDGTLAYTYTDARDPNDAWLPRVPRHALTLALDAQLSDRLSGRLAVKYLGGRTDTDVNSFAPVTMPDVTLVDASMTYDLTDQVSAALRVENLFDQDYQSVHGYGAPGRSVYLGLQAKF